MDFDFESDDSPLARANRRSKPFTAEETTVLLREVKARKHVIYGSKEGPPKSLEVRKAWDEIAYIVSTIEGITRTGLQCRKRYSNVQKKGNQKRAAVNLNLKNVKTPDSSVTFENKSLEFGGLQGVLKEEPVDQESEGAGVELLEEDYSVERRTAVQAAASSRRSNSLNSLQPEELPFLNAQQNGFNMLEEELLGMRQSISSLNTRLNRVEVLLRPVGHIANSMGRIASALEHLFTQ